MLFCSILQVLQVVYCATDAATCIILSNSCTDLQVAAVPEMSSADIPTCKVVGQSTVVFRIEYYRIE